MTLAQDTEALLLDEPTTFLDLAHQVEVLDLLHRLRAERGRTVVAVLHDLNQAARYADHLIAMRDGAVVAAGPPREILTADLVRDVFGLDCVVVPCPVTGAPLVVPALTGGAAAAPAPCGSGRPGHPPLHRRREQPARRLVPLERNLMRRLAAALTAAVALGVGLTACGESDPVAGTATGETREITHAMGTTKVPAEPEARRRARHRQDRHGALAGRHAGRRGHRR